MLVYNYVNEQHLLVVCHSGLAHRNVSGHNVPYKVLACVTDAECSRLGLLVGNVVNLVESIGLSNSIMQKVLRH